MRSLATTRALRGVQFTFWVLFLALLAVVLPIPAGCITMTDPLTGETVVDWERQSRLVEAEAQVFRDLAVTYPNRSDSLNQIASTLQATSDVIAQVTGEDPEGALEAIDSALGALLPYLKDADDDVKFSAVAARAVLSVARVYLEDDFDGDTPFEPGDTVPPQ